MPDLPAVNGLQTIKAIDAGDQACARQHRSKAELEAFEKAAAERLFAALQLLHVPQLTARLAEAPQLCEEVNDLLPVLSVLARGLDDMLRLRNAHAAMFALATSLEGNEHNQSLIGVLREHMQQVAAGMNELQQQWLRADYPFEHAKGPMSLEQYLIPKSFLADDLGSLHEAAAEVLEKLPTLYVRVAGRLATIAEQVETAIGIDRRDGPE